MSDTPERRPIYYGRDGNTVTLKMSTGDYDLLLTLIGYAVGGAALQGDQALAQSWLGLADRMNFMNPRYARYREDFLHSLESYTKTASKS